MASRDAWVFRRGVLWSSELGRRPTNPPAARVAAEFGQLETSSFSELIEAACQMDLISPSALASRIKSGRQCFAGRVDGCVVAYGWVTRGPEWVGELEREINIPESDAYIWDCATLPAYRRQRLFSTLIGYVANQQRREGLRRLWIIAKINASSMIRAVAAAGFEPVLNLAYLRLYDRRFLLTSPVRGASSSIASDARGLFDCEDEQHIGPLAIGNSARPTPPDTHHDT